MPPEDTRANAAPASRFKVVGAIGIGQIFAWGSSYYLIAVLAAPIAADTRWPLAWVVGGLSLAFLVSGCVAAPAGRLIEEFGGKPVLAASATVLAAGLLLMACARNVPTYVAAWLILGVGMGGGLYDAAFSGLGRLYGAQARGAITHVTLIAGFASTICWPLSALLVERFGWRGACAAYAALDLAVVLPLYLLALPDEPRRAVVPIDRRRPVAPAPRRRAAFVVLATSLTMASVVMTVVSVHLLTLLQDRGLGLTAAVALGAAIGPSQVGARVIETMLGTRHHPLWTLLASTILVALGLALLYGSAAAIGAGLVLYGAGSGIRSIARGTVPLALFGPEGYATLMGRLVVPTLLAQAAAPTLGAFLLQRAGAGPTLAVVTLFATLALVPVVMLFTFVSDKRADDMPLPR